MSHPDGLVRACVDRIDSEFAIIDADGTIVYTNGSWQRFAVEGGFPGDPAMIGEDYLGAVRAARDDDRFAEAACDGFEELTSGEREAFRLEYPCPSPDEPFRWFLLSASSVTFEGEQYIAVEHVDITERVRVERQLRHRNETLETVGSILSHDIRSPMAAALGWGQAIQSVDEPDPEHIDRMVRSLERMDAMIDDAVFLARGLLVEETEFIRLGSVVDRAWGAVAPETARLDSRGDITVEADPTLLQTLLENLFRNSVEHGSTNSRTQSDDAAEHASAEVTVTVGTLDGGFYVADDGPGIPENQRESVFDAGYTSRSTAENTGMGLAIVEGIAHAHQWEIELTESDSGGARFEITQVRTVADEADR